MPETVSDPDYYAKRWLMQNSRTQPALYVYVTTSPEQWTALSAKYPHLRTYYQGLPTEQTAQLDRLRTRIANLEKQNQLPSSRVLLYQNVAVHRSRLRSNSGRSPYFQRQAIHPYPVPAPQHQYAPAINPAQQHQRAPGNPAHHTGSGSSHPNRQGSGVHPAGPQHGKHHERK